MTYLNVKINGKVETVDQINQLDFISYKEYRTELKRILNEYRTASNYYNSIYTSKRCTNNWKNN